MATTRQVIYSIKEYLKAYSDDSEHTDEYILFLLNNEREEYLRQLYDDRRRKIDNVLIQSMCLELETVDRGSCGIEVGCSIVRTVKKLPKLLEMRRRTALLSVRPVDILAKSFTLTTRDNIDTVFDSRYNLDIYAFLHSDGHIYIVSKDNSYIFMKCIEIELISADPSELTAYKNCCGCDENNNPSTDCFNEDSDYPAQGFVINYITDRVTSKLVPRLQIPKDVINNSNEH